MGFYDEKFILKILKKLQTDKPSLEHDHSYASPYQVLTAKTKFAWPTTYLFTQNQSNISNSLDEIIDIESSDDLCEVCNETDYKMSKRFSMQDKLDMAAEMGLIHNLEMRTEDWQTNLPKYTWSQPEISIFERSWKALSNFYDETLIKMQADNKDLLILEKYGETFREIYCDFDWNLALCKWLHNIFCHFLPISYLGLYAQILNSLAIKIPWLIFNMLTMDNSSQEVKVDNPLNEYITTLLLQTIQHSTKITPSTVLKESTNSSNPSSFNNNEFHCEMFEKQYLELFSINNNSPLDIHCIMIPSLPNLDIIASNVDENTFNNSKNDIFLQSQGYFALQRLKVWMEHLLPSQWSFDIINPVDDDLIQQKQATDLNKGNELSSQDWLSFTITYLNRLKEKLKDIMKRKIKVVSTNANSKSINNNVRTILWSWGLSSLFAAYDLGEINNDSTTILTNGHMDTTTPFLLENGKKPDDEITSLDGDTQSPNPLDKLDKNETSALSEIKTAKVKEPKAKVLTPSSSSSSSESTSTTETQTEECDGESLSSAAAKKLKTSNILPVPLPCDNVETKNLAKKPVSTPTPNQGVPLKPKVLPTTGKKDSQMPPPLAQKNGKKPQEKKEKSSTSSVTSTTSSEKGNTSKSNKKAKGKIPSLKSSSSSTTSSSSTSKSTSSSSDSSSESSSS